MLFTTDKQTQDDLNIFGKRGSDSILSLFSRTATINGARVLEEMFRYPLSDANAINHRSRLIGYLKDVRAVFPFQSEWFDRAEQYLANTDDRTKISGDKIPLEKKITHLLAADPDYMLVANGVSALIDIIKALDTLLKNTLLQQASPFQDDPETVNIIHLMNSEPASVLLKEQSNARLPREQLAKYDTLLRFKYGQDTRRIMAFIYRFDVYVTIGKVASQRDFIFAKAFSKDEHSIKADAFYHPQLQNAVPNSLHLDRDANVVFLTGANMAGKSTFMKSLGIVIYLAHMGFPVPAKKMEFSVLDGVFTSINLPDDLGMGASHFYAEVMRVKKVAKELHAGKKLFVIFDELFRGTNVKDAYEATIAITAAFASKRNSMFVISTHIIEASEVLRQRCANITFKYLPTWMNGNIPQYTYTLQEGITDDRHGMVIINNEGILELLKKGKGVTTL